MTIYTVKVDDIGDKFWYVDNKLHRTDGPAIEWASGSKEWWLDGKYLTHSQWIEVVQPKVVGCVGQYLDTGEGFTQAQWKQAVKPKVASCAGKIVEVDGVKYKLVAA
jgi:hypothetical protein